MLRFGFNKSTGCIILDNRLFFIKITLKLELTVTFLVLGRLFSKSSSIN